MNIKTAIKIFQSYLDEEVVSAAKIKLGLSNHNFKIVTKNNQYIIRIPDEKTSKFFNRSIESKVNKLVEPLNIDVPTILFDDSNGVKITKYINHYRFTKKKYYQEIADIIKSIHNLKVDKEFFKFDLIESYYQYSSSIRKVYFKTFKEKTVIDFIKKELENTSELVLCHNDLVPNNFLFGNHKIYLIDYEYARVNHYLFDIASFITENNIDDLKEQEKFYQAYFGNSLNDSLRNRLKYWILFLDLYWTKWANMMYDYYHLDIYYLIGTKKFARYSINSSKLCIK